MSDLARLALEVNEAQFALGNECFEAEGARFVRNLRFPEVRDANHVSFVAASSAEAIRRLLARMDLEHAASPARSVHCDFLTPPAVEAALLLLGFRSCAVIVSVLEGDLAGTSVEHDIREASSDRDLEELRVLQSMDWEESLVRQARGDDAAAGEACALSRRLKCPPGRFFLALAGGMPCGHVSALPGLHGMGQVEDLFVASAFRRRGIARALIRRAVDACREAGASRVVIAADATDFPKDAYAAMGFRAVAVKRDYWTG